MEITFIKEQKAEDFIKKMEKKYKTIEILEKEYEKKDDPLLYIDLNNWKYLINNPNEINENITEIKTHVMHNVDLLTIDFKLLELIKTENPESIEDIKTILNKSDENVYTIENKLNYLNENGLIDFDHNKPVVNYDKIEIAI